MIYSGGNFVLPELLGRMDQLLHLPVRLPVGPTAVDYH